MPEISRFFGIVISMYYKDHSPPHFHARSGDDDAMIDIETGELLEGELGRKQLRLIQAWTELHKDELLSNYKESQKDAPHFQENRSVTLMLHHIKKIVGIEDLKLAIEFDAGEIRKINFEPIFKKWSTTSESHFRELLDFSNFRKVHVHPEFQTIYWENGVDLDPNVLYEMSTPVQND